MTSQRQILVLDSKFRTNPEDKDHLYKFKLNARIRFNGMIKLEQFIFQNSQYVFSPEKRSDKFIYTEEGNDPINININGMFDNIDAFVKGFNDVMSINGIQIRMKYTASLYEIKILRNDNQDTKFSLEEYYDDGTFMDLIGFRRSNEGSNVYTNINTPKLFSQRIIFISIPELGTYSITTRGINSSSKPYTYLVLSKPGFEIVANINNTFANEFYVNDRDIDELSVRIHDSDGLPFVNNKSNANFIIVLSY